MKRWPDNYLNVQQGSAEWFEARRGCVTASRVKDVVAKLKNGKESAARQSYKLELLTEIITGRATEHFVSMAMDFGIENEPLARSVYEMAKGVEVERIGYVRHPFVPRSGASPDGLVGTDGLVEIKVPNTTTHLEYLLADEVPSEYKPQMIWQMACTGRLWCDFVSYDPRLPEEFGLFVKRLECDGAQINYYEEEVEKFISELNALCERLQSHAHAAPPLTRVPEAQITSEL
jgi:putative phage-type endonuclease